MSNRQRFEELAVRCEASVGPDRKLDALIWCALNGKKYVSHFPAYYSGGDSPQTQVEFTEPPKRTRLVSNAEAYAGHARPVTASIDAAMTLVPEGHCGQVQFGKHTGAWVAALEDECPADFNVAASPALALTAACLRARAATDTPKGNQKGTGDE